MVNARKTLVNWIGLLGVVSFIFYAAAVIITPLAYPGYDWMSRAVSDLMADNAPSRALWTQLSSLDTGPALVCVTMVCVVVSGKLNRTLRLGIYACAAMVWVSMIGYSAFPLSAIGTGLAPGGYFGLFQRFSNMIAVNGFIATLGIYLFLGKFDHNLDRGVSA